MITLAYFAYWLCVTYVEKRAPTELMLKGAATYFGVGASIGAAELFFVVGILAALGFLQIYSRAVTLAVLIPVASAATASLWRNCCFGECSSVFSSNGSGAGSPC